MPVDQRGGMRPGPMGVRGARHVAIRAEGAGPRALGPMVPLSAEERRAREEAAELARLEQERKAAAQRDAQEVRDN